MKFASSLPCLILLLALGACGGGGSTAPVAPPVAVQSTPPALSVDVSPVAANDPGSALPANWQNGVFIEIYVRGYKDSNGDGIGDLKGVTQSLDYLKDLGVSGIWLMPVTRSQDHDHGYAVEDYRDIEAQYGSLADLDELVAQAHARGIGVIIDYVMNHSAATNPLFQNSLSSAGAYYRNWYVWSASHPAGWSIYGGDPWRTAASGYYFAGFWDQMPDFNLRNADVVAFHHSNLRFWLNRGVDGFRFDAVGNLVENGASGWENQPENYTIMGNVRSLLNGYSQRYMVCEDPPDPIGFSASAVCGSAFGFGHSSDIVSAAQGNTTAINAVANYFTTAPATVATMVSNHDSFAGMRLFNQVGGNLGQYKLAAATYLLQPGIPFIYYGEEIGMAGGQGLSGDPSLRTPMSWTSNGTTAGFTTAVAAFRALSSNVATYNVAAQQSDPNSLLAYYKALIQLRKSRVSLSRGSYDAPQVQGSVMRFGRTFGTEHTLVVINYGTSAATPTIGSLPGSVSLTPLYPTTASTVTTNGAGQVSLALPAQSVQVYGY